MVTLQFTGKCLHLFLRTLYWVMKETFSRKVGSLTQLKVENNILNVPSTLDCLALSHIGAWQ